MVCIFEFIFASRAKGVSLAVEQVICFQAIHTKSQSAVDAVIFAVIAILLYFGWQRRIQGVPETVEVPPFLGPFLPYTLFNNRVYLGGGGEIL